MFRVLQGGVYQGLSHGRWTFGSNALHRVKPQRVEQSNSIVVVLSVDLTGLHWAVVLRLSKILII